MLITAKDMIGKKVIVTQTGEEVDKVKDVLFSQQQKKVLGLLISTGGMLSDAKVLMLSDVESIGKDAVMISSPDLIRKASETGEEIKTIAKDGDDLTKTKVVTQTGEELGKVSDLVFESTSGDVDRMEVSQGLQNVVSGKKFIRPSDIVNIGKDVTIVSQYVVQQLEQQAQQGGIQGALEKGKQTVGQAAGSIQEKAPGMMEQVKGKAAELKDQVTQKGEEMKTQAQEKTQDPTTQQKVEQAKGQLFEAAATVLGTIQAVQDEASQKAYAMTKGGMASSETAQAANQKVEDVKDIPRIQHIQKDVERTKEDVQHEAEAQRDEIQLRMQDEQTADDSQLHQ